MGIVLRCLHAIALRLLSQRGLQASDAADVVQEVLLRVAKGILTFDYDPTKGRFRDWLYRIVYHEICRLANSRKQTQLLNINDKSLQQREGREWNEHFYNHILRTAMERIRHRFESDTWQAFSKVWLNHQPAQDVAKQMERSIDFVYLSKSRVVKRLRLEVEQLADDAGIGHG